MARSLTLEIEFYRRWGEGKLEVGDKIAILPLNYLEHSTISYRSHVYDKKYLIGRYYYAFPEVGIVCGINRKSANNDEFVPYILPSTYITSFLLERKEAYNPTSLDLNSDRYLMESICYNIANGTDIYTAMHSDAVYVVRSIIERSVDIVIGPSSHPIFEPYEFTSIKLSKTEDIHITFDGRNCRIGNQTLDRQLFTDYVGKILQFEPNIYTLSQEEIDERREQATQNEQNNLLSHYNWSLINYDTAVDLDRKHGKEINDYSPPRIYGRGGISLSGYGQFEIKDEYRHMNEQTREKAEQLYQDRLAKFKNRKEAEREERQEQQRIKQEEIDRQSGWKDIGSVRVAQYVSYKLSDSYGQSVPKFEHHSTCELQTNASQTKFRIKMGNDYQDLERVNLSNIFKPQWVYKSNKGYYVLEDLSKFRFWTK
jgi:hypothetical protein